MDQDRLKQAAALIRAGRYHEAKDILETMPTNPKAREWLAKVEERLINEDPFERDDPFADAGGYYDEKPKRKNDQVPVVRSTQRDYTTMSIIILLLYWVFWLPGLVANIIMLNEAKQQERNTGIRPDGLGCLWALLLFNVIPVVLFCLGVTFLVIAGPSIESTFEEIVVTLGATPAR